MKNQTYTPKWRVESRSMSDGSLVIKNGDHDEICCIREKADRVRGYQDNLDIERGKIICRAVNCHEQLVAALRGLLEYTDAIRIKFCDDVEVAAARAAIAEVRKENKT